MSGIPAWGKNMSDEYIWNMAAFLQQLPDLDEEQYKALVATSGGHSHGGGETQPHEEPAGVPDDHSDMPMEGMPMAGSEPHVDPPGRSEEHTSELQSLMRISYAVFCLKKQTT